MLGITGGGVDARKVSLVLEGKGFLAAHEVAAMRAASWVEAKASLLGFIGSGVTTQAHSQPERDLHVQVADVLVLSPEQVLSGRAGVLPGGRRQVDEVAGVADAKSVTRNMFTVAIGLLRFTELSKIRSNS